MARFLDKYAIKWEYESLPIIYYDTERKLMRNTIPDFYLPDFNFIIEVKSNGEFKTQITRDKLKGVEKQDYKTILFGRKQIEILRENPLEMLSEIKKLI